MYPAFDQVDLDGLDQNKAVNKAGNIVGKFTGSKSKIADTALQPYDEVFGLQRFRETELIHGRQVPALSGPFLLLCSMCVWFSSLLLHAMQRVVSM